MNSIIMNSNRLSGTANTRYNVLREKTNICSSNLIRTGDSMWPKRNNISLTKPTCWTHSVKASISLMGILPESRFCHSGNSCMITHKTVTMLHACLYPQISPMLFSKSPLPKNSWALLTSAKTFKHSRVNTYIFSMCFNPSLSMSDKISV